jgi:hypothetical protein
MVHQLRAHKAQMAAGGPGGQQQPGGMTMSAAPGQQGYGGPPPGAGDMVGAGVGGGSPDEMSRVLGPVGKGNVQ